MKKFRNFLESNSLYILILSELSFANLIIYKLYGISTHANILTLLNLIMLLSLLSYINNVNK